jgi:hypothetical protein
MINSFSACARRPVYRASLPLVILSFLPGGASAQASEDHGPAGPAGVREVYQRHDRAAAAARKSGDWATVRRHAAAVDTLFNGNPAALMSVARASARLGDVAGALDLVRTVLSAGITRNLAGDADLEALRRHPEWPSLLARNDANARAAGTPRQSFALPSGDFLAEDIAWDGARRRYLVSSVRQGTVVSVGSDGRVAPFIAREARLWGAFAAVVDSARERLWVTTAAMPQYERFTPSDSGKAAIVRFDLGTGREEKRYIMRETARGNAPGDASVAPNGDLFVADGRTGIVYTIRNAADSLEVLVPEGTFMSAQGSAVIRDGSVLYVADYIRGIARVHPQTGAVKWLGHSRNVALNGIDGLVSADDSTLIGVQNGIMPHRVVLLRLDSSGDRVIEARVLAQDSASIREPTHGVVRGREFLFIANSGWDQFEDDGSLKKDVALTHPVVVSIPIALRR